ncbi:hypothetical protein AB1Y20_019293 [Prymnesium parvum]|uniref:C2 domain-containing protein n=1 Tax=Prymnesium parvum TaxID=97485 RepID=A0AB34JTL2_PRYPA
MARRRTRLTVNEPSAASEDDDDAQGESPNERSPLKPSPFHDEELTVRERRRRSEEAVRKGEAQSSFAVSPEKGECAPPRVESRRRMRATLAESKQDADHGHGGTDSKCSPADDMDTPHPVPGAKRRLSLGNNPLPAGVLRKFRRNTSQPANVGSADDGEQPASTQTPPGASQKSGGRLALGLTERRSPRMFPLTQQMQAERTMYTLPRVGLFDWLSLRLGRETEGARYTRPISELHDGLFVDEMPAITSRALTLLNTRLGPSFQPASKAARTEAGSVLRQPDPVRHVRVRPAHFERQPDPRTSIARLQPSTKLVEAADRPKGSQHALQVSLGLLQFHDHPLFLREHMLQQRLRSLAEQLTEHNERETVQQYERKISELALTVRHLEQQLPSRTDSRLGTAGAQASEHELRLASLCIELLQARRLRDEHECTERLLARRMLLLWQDLKEARRSQGFQATRSRLQVQPVEFDLHEDKEEMERDLEDELHERRLVQRAQGAESDDRADDEIRNEIATRQEELRRPPGEDLLVPVYSEHAEPSPINQVVSSERVRVLEAARVSVYAVLLVDGRVVSSTAAISQDPYAFCLQFSTSLQLQLLQAPVSMTLQLWQRHLAGLNDRLLAEFFLAIPDSASPTAPAWQQYSFSNERPFANGSDHAQMNVVSDGQVTSAGHRCLCGQIAVSVAWAAQPARHHCGGKAVASTYGAKPSRGASELSSGSLDTQRVRQLVKSENLDPNAPQDVPLLSILSRADRSGFSGTFRLHWLRRELLWVKDWLMSDRMHLLELRRKKPHEWHALPASDRAVPSRDTEIRLKQRELLQPSSTARVDEETLDAMNRRESKVRNWAEKVKAKQQVASVSERYLLTSQDVVREPLLEVEAAEFSCSEVLKLFAPRRQLLPRRKPRKAAPGSNNTPRQLEIVVQAGVDLPVRDYGQARTRPFVEISFQGNTMATTVKEGVNPVWNQLIHLEMTVPDGDWSQTALAALPDEIDFNLFDSVRKSEKDVREENVSKVSNERRWLGVFSLPFSTLYRNGKVEGTFPLKMPPILLGYKKDKTSPSKKLVPNSGLALFVTIEPLLPPLRDTERERSTTRDIKMQEFAKSWLKSIRRGLPRESRSRNILVFAPNETGDRTLVCRYVRPQDVPSELQAGDEHLLLRYVSLIPRIDDAAMGLRLDIWNTSQLFLELNAGDEEEHALLLCNFFLASGKEAYVLMGHGIPEGETAYVLTREPTAVIRLWNAQSGAVYDANDSACPLTSVGCVFDDKNVWANIQAIDNPAEMNWKLDDPKCWRPFFGDRGFEPPDVLHSVQDARLRFKRTTEEYRRGIETSVEKALRREFQSLRGARATDWHWQACKDLKPLLKKYEEDANGVKVLSEAAHNVALEKINATYRLVGVPINETYIDVRSLMVKLRNTNIHTSDAPNIKFALVVYVHAYPNEVCSVWFYIASVEDLRAGARANYD